MKSKGGRRGEGSRTKKNYYTTLLTHWKKLAFVHKKTAKTNKCLPTLHNISTPFQLMPKQSISMCSNATQWDLIIISLLVHVSIMAGLCTWKQAKKKNHYGSPLEFNHAHYSINSLHFSLTWGASLISGILKQTSPPVRDAALMYIRMGKMLIWKPIILQSTAQGSPHLPRWHF